MEITAKMVKDLRECTGAGMMECKKALTESQGDMDAAVDILRTKGLAALAKKAGRATNEGVIGGYVSDDGRTGALVELNCETDFVARNADFKTFVTEIATHVAGAAPSDISELMAQTFTDRDMTFEAVLGESVGRIGENIQVPRFERYELGSDAGAITIYIHGVGNIGVMTEIAATSDEAATSTVFAAFARDIAMQIAATSPIAVHRDDMPSSIVEHEMDIYKAQAAESGKPEAIQEKIARGRLDKFYKEVCLLEQDFVKDPDSSVSAYTDRVAKELGTGIEIVRFTRFVLGETAESSDQ
ncbi:MAG: elongation factor Ts [Clostridiales bacterium]|nr:elongation factor Ts [Clostridiales bacterium]